MPIRKRVTQKLQEKFNRKQALKVGKKAAKFLNKQFALVVLAFFVLSLNVVSAPAAFDSAAVNPLLDYEPDALVKTNRDVAVYVPIINLTDPQELADQLASAVVGPETSYVPKPLIPETVDHKTADLIRRGLRHEIASHTVQQGETISQIAALYGINVATILHDNGINPSDAPKIKPGAKLSIAPENSSDAVSWLDKIQKQEQAAREKAAKEKAAKLAQSSKSRRRLVSTASAEDDSPPGSFAYPIRGKRDCVNGYHWWAVDCPNSIGTTVVAGAGGVVRVADGSGYNGGYGKTVLIDHGNGWETRYAHLSSVEVSNGERVSAGEEIAKSGNTGNSTGPHLHFEAIYGGQRVNPRNLIH